MFSLQSELMRPSVLDILRELLTDLAQDAELEEMIAAGWGNVPQDRIPKNWRTRRGPERLLSAQRKAAILRARRARLAARAQAALGQSLGADRPDAFLGREGPTAHGRTRN